MQLKIIFDILNTRELAIALWLLIGSIACLFSKNIRQSLKALLRASSARFLWILYIGLFGYTVFSVYLLSQVGLWANHLIKDTILWGFLSGLGAIIQYNRKDSFKANTRLWFRDAASITAIVIFVSQEYTFGLIVEFITVPLLIIVGGVQAVAETRKDPASKKLVQIFTGLLIIYGLSTIGFSIYQIVADPSDFFTLYTLQSFLLPILLLILFIPFYYAVMFYSLYESLMIWMTWPIRNDTGLQLYLKKNIRRYSKASLFKLEKLHRAKSYVNPLLRNVQQIDSFFDWLNAADKKINEVINQHDDLQLEKLLWDEITEVQLYDGQIIRGIYDYYESAFHNYPDEEVVLIFDNDEQIEIPVSKIQKIVSTGVKY